MADSEGGIKQRSPDSAAKEAWEEAGVLGQVDAKKIGTYEYYKRGETLTGLRFYCQ